MMRAVTAAAVVALCLTYSPNAEAAARTTCLCRTEDGKSFEDRGLLHHRWACDYHLRYVVFEDEEAKPADPDEPPRRRRPEGQTCTDEEIIQFKVYLCMRNGCTYPYSRETQEENAALRTIKKLETRRRP